MQLKFLALDSQIFLRPKIVESISKLVVGYLGMKQAILVIDLLWIWIFGNLAGLEGAIWSSQLVELCGKVCEDARVLGNQMVALKGTISWGSYQIPQGRQSQVQGRYNWRNWALAQGFCQYAQGWKHWQSCCQSGRIVFLWSCKVGGWWWWWSWSPT